MADKKQTEDMREDIDRAWKLAKNRKKKVEELILASESLAKCIAILDANEMREELPALRQILLRLLHWC